MEVPRYFKVSTVAAMLGGVGEDFIRGEMRRGRFFPADGAAIDTSTVQRVAGNDMISTIGLEWYRRMYCEWPRAREAADFLQNEMMGVVQLDAVEPGISARTPGELRRKEANG